MKDKAYAKINLALDVCGIREDGYHEIDSIMLPINFYDLLEIRISDQDSYRCNWPYIRDNENNSIHKMISVLKEKYHITDHFMIDLYKSVPTQAGLGGGTADAASALRILKKLYHLDPSEEEIREICTQVGADVLFNYHNVPARVTGIGDVLKEIAVKNDYHILLVKPKKGVSTPAAYGLLDLDRCIHPDIDSLQKALADGTSIEGLLGNSMQEAAMSLNEEIKEAIDSLKAAGARNVLMSGSGSTVFCISEDQREIMRLYQKLRDTHSYVRFGKILKKQQKKLIV